MSTDPGCEDHEVGPVMGYVSVNKTSQTTSVLYRCLNPAGLHLQTTNSQECTDAGYTIEGILGYVP